MTPFSKHFDDFTVRTSNFRLVKVYNLCILPLAEVVYARPNIPCSGGTGRQLDHQPLTMLTLRHVEKCSASAMWVRGNKQSRGDNWMWRRARKSLAAVPGPHSRSSLVFIRDTESVLQSQVYCETSAHKPCSSGQTTVCTSNCDVQEQYTG